MADQPAPPKGVLPYLTIAGGRAGEAMDFYKSAFGAEEVVRMPGEGGKLMHAEMRLNDGELMFSDSFDGTGEGNPSSVTLHLNVDDADKWFKRATDAGCTVTIPLEDQFWGDRYGKVRDPFGHEWSIASAAKK